MPVRYGDASRNVQTIIQENSTNNMPSTPLMTFYINSLEYDRPRMQDPYFVSKINVRQRTYDETTETFEVTQGNAFTIERLMPVPYKLGITLDIWTSNTNQKMQLLEQLLTLFNPSLEIQSTDNYIDWTSLSVVELDQTIWSSRSVPIGTENPIDIASLKFSLPIWISPPAKIKKLGVIERVIASMYDAEGDLENAVTDNDLLLGTRQVITPYNYAVVVIGNSVQCVQPKLLGDEPQNNEMTPTDVISESELLWPSVIDLYGTLRPGVSQLRLLQADETEIVGTIALNPADNRFLIFDIDADTVPGNTLPPVDAIVDPLSVGPGYGLPAAENGQRYLLTEDTGAEINAQPVGAWLGTTQRSDLPLIAKANDIIEFRGSRWIVAFRSQGQGPGQFVTNITTGVQYEWTGTSWVKSYQGIYPGGTWRLVL